MIAVEIDSSQMMRLKEAVGRAGKKVAKELSAAINQVSKKTRLDMGRAVRETVALKKDQSEKPISVAMSSTPANLQALVRLKKTKRLGLRHFGAKQDRKGVTYKIAKNGGRKRINGAFQGPKPGVLKMSWKGNVFIRRGAATVASKGRYRGQLRQPIVQLNGVSAYGAYVKNELTAPQVAAVFDQLVHQIERRINLNILRAEGLVKT